MNYEEERARALQALSQYSELAPSVVLDARVFVGMGAAATHAIRCRPGRS